MNATTELTVELPLNVSREEAQLAQAVRLFQKGKVSFGQAAAMAGFEGGSFSGFVILSAAKKPEGTPPSQSVR